MKRTVKNTMLCWNPGTAEVELIPWPDRTGASRQYRMSTLACNAGVQKKTFEQRKSLAFIEAMVLIIRDGCDPAAVHKTMLGLEEYRDGCPGDMPFLKRHEGER
jgi:hypothetical protein